MLKKTITYENFDGNSVTEDLYFNLTKSELIEIAIDLPDGMSDGINPENIDEEQAVSKIMETLGNKGILRFIKDLVLKSYGIKSADGRRFAKVDDNGKALSIEFSQTMAFETILDEFMTDDVAASNFVNSIIPAAIADKMPNVKKIQAKASANQ